MSRIPVREAIQRLETEGFIAAQARKGAFVAPLGPAEAADFFDIREHLEALAASLAARRADRAGLRTLEKLLDRARRAAGSPAGSANWARSMPTSISRSSSCPATRCSRA